MKFVVVFVLVLFVSLCEGITMKQFEASLDTLRSLCQPKFKLTTLELDNLRNGIFTDEPEVKCYTRCIAQMTGTLTKKGELSIPKMRAQIEMIVPLEVRPNALDSLEQCTEVQKNYKDSCDKTYYTIKCGQEKHPDTFKFP